MLRKWIWLLVSQSLLKQSSSHLLSGEPRDAAILHV
ncbi:hypothetical protein LEMLEM_LOCUS20150 [Lemmus lemmus]